MAALLISTISCSNSEKKYEEEEKSLIADYIARNNITVAPDASGLYYIELIPGTGENIEIGDSLGVYYTGWFLDGTEFNDNTEETTPFRFRLNSYGLIEGWTIGLPKMKLGTKAQLLSISQSLPTALSDMGIMTTMAVISRSFRVIHRCCLRYR
ncbi:MAG: FKBP-type peptidyl-prolyl cis-trans isomerase [Marinilabiliales bacterium]|nr:FKBP-type peptidyl-prolyl cis-trans isomerase [Marinilabiliales bacterium]